MRTGIPNLYLRPSTRSAADCAVSRLFAVVMLQLAVWILGGECGIAKTTDALPAEHRDFFESKVRPLLVARCYECHSKESGKQKGGLLLDSKLGWETGGDSGPAIVPSDAEQSLLATAISYRDFDLKMPPDGRISDEELAVLLEWIEMGAPDPRTNAQPDEKPPAESIDFESARDYWAFRSPTSRDGDTIDSLVAAKLDEQGLAPVGPASQRQLVRRAFQALHGVPPTPEQVRAFVEDDAPDAFSRLVDRLLASPRYGERWGRHWLDVTRYADTNGLDENMAYTSAYRFRDYVIGAFNSDKPYDAFIIEQLAGDLLPSGQDPEHLQTIAAGFLSVGPKMLACDDPMKMRMDIVDDQVDTTGRAFLGMTLGCARCHDHKFDPISTADYYALAGIFKSTTTITNYKVVAKWHEHDMSPPEVVALDAQISELEKAKKGKDDAAKKEIDGKIRKLRADRERRSTRIMAVRDGEVADTQVHLRGNYLTLGETVPRRFPVVLAGENQAPLPVDRSGRLQLAQWIASANNPLTARVMVNRLWRWHFGRGIVATPDNFGRLGEAPSNQPLLDHLAARFVESGWSIKAMHRYILNSEAYQRSTRHDTGNAVIDPENVYHWRFSRRRLDAEEVRDALLATSGLLDSQMFGQLLTDEFGKYASKGKLDEYWNTRRRAVYLPVMRSGLYDAFVAFDFSDPSVINGNRKASTVAPQALFMMNGPLVFDAAKSIANRAKASGTPVADLYQRILKRSPDAAELDEANAFLERYQQQSEQPDAAQGLQALCRVLLASNDFLYVE